MPFDGIRQNCTSPGLAVDDSKQEIVGRLFTLAVPPSFLFCFPVSLFFLLCVLTHSLCMNGDPLVLLLFNLPLYACLFIDEKGGSLLFC